MQASESSVRDVHLRLSTYFLVDDLCVMVKFMFWGGANESGLIFICCS